MAFFEDVFKGGNVATGVAFGLGAAVIAPVVAPVLGAVVRPLAKTTIKLGMMAYDTVAEGMTRAADATTGAPAGNIFAEARAELDAGRSARGTATGPTPATTATGGDKPGDKGRAASAPA